jgi:hypothetical protein
VLISLNMLGGIAPPPPHRALCPPFRGWGRGRVGVLLAACVRPVRASGCVRPCGLYVGDSDFKVKVE